MFKGSFGEGKKINSDIPLVSCKKTVSTPREQDPWSSAYTKHMIKGTTRELWKHFGENASIQLENNHGKWIYSIYFSFLLSWNPR